MIWVVVTLFKRIEFTEEQAADLVARNIRETLKAFVRKGRIPEEEAFVDVECWAGHGLNSMFVSLKKY